MKGVGVPKDLEDWEDEAAMRWFWPIAEKECEAAEMRVPLVTVRRHYRPGPYQPYQRTSDGHLKLNRNGKPVREKVRRFGSSGKCNRIFGITVNFGSNRTDRKYVLLHELAHWLDKCEHSHGDEFWTIVWRLSFAYMPEDIDRIKMLAREYKANALNTFPSEELPIGA